MKTLIALSLAGVMFGIGGCAVYAEPGYYGPPPPAVVVRPYYGSHYYGRGYHRW